MSQFTYETENTNSKLETYEWDNVWIEQTENKSKKRVLYIGDSISCGTRNIATKVSGEEYLFDGFGSSKALDNPFLYDSIRLFVSQLTGVETVLFNNGLHGWHLDDNTEYREFYENAIKFMLEEFDGKKIFLVLTTSVADAEREERVKARNAVALSLAEKYNLHVIDLYTASVDAVEFRLDDGVHFSGAGYHKLAEKILEEISK